MSTSSQPQTQVNRQFPGAQGPTVRSSLVPKPVIPSKRSDDDIQFISSQPVKRRRVSEQRPEPTPLQQNDPAMHIAPVSIPPVGLPPIEFRDSERRISTGIVGLPSDFNALELTCALRGVSLPVLEKFVLDQPLRKPRPLSPPELSPKQLPCTVAPAMLSYSAHEDVLRPSSFHTAPVACMMAYESSPELETPFQNSPNSSLAASQFHVLNTPATHASPPLPAIAGPSKEPDPKGLRMRPPPLPIAKMPISRAALDSPPISKSPTHITARSDAKQPCQICARMRQQADLAKAQGLPMLHHGMPHHMIPQMPCHPPFGQHLHPQMMAMGPNNMHAFSSGFAPIMMPINGNNFTTFSSHVPSLAQTNQQGNGTNSQPTPEKPSDQSQPSPATTNGTTTKSPVPSNPVKPPASLIQPTYRKPSPNLIVDVAETCQEKFPFEEVAKRHNVPVEKVFDVFAAIIQVPLLRCPTDRRRAGRLATSRVKEYARAKRAIQENSSQGSSEPRDEIVVRPSDVADHLGQVDLPDGFNLRDP
ncbi:hypothetical protein F4677DRAFT_414642 [Hypoxylon crocopeplum]|nr:hypothetical protein F4677DRAFT_414642 [Hypoxylon crocopeplum]